MLFLEYETSLIYFQTDTTKQKDTKDIAYKTFDWKISDNDVIELARALYAANISFYQGKKTKFIDIVRQLELFFGKKVKRPHNKVTRIGERADISPFLDALKDCYVNDLVSRL